jgi:hypothetical protein
MKFCPFMMIGALSNHTPPVSEEFRSEDMEWLIAVCKCHDDCALYADYKCSLSKSEKDMTPEEFDAMQEKALKRE